MSLMLTVLKILKENQPLGVHKFDRLFHDKFPFPLSWVPVVNELIKKKLMHDKGFVITDLGLRYLRNTPEPKYDVNAMEIYVLIHIWRIRSLPQMNGKFLIDNEVSIPEEWRLSVDKLIAKKYLKSSGVSVSDSGFKFLQNFTSGLY